MAPAAQEHTDQRRLLDVSNGAGDKQIGHRDAGIHKSQCSGIDTSRKQSAIVGNDIEMNRDGGSRVQGGDDHVLEASLDAESGLDGHSTVLRHHFSFQASVRGYADDALDGGLVVQLF